MKAIKQVFRIVGFTIGVVLAMLVLAFLLFSCKVHGDTEKRIITALETNYLPAHVEVNDREDWQFGGSDWSFGGQVCFAIAVRRPGGQSSENKVAMVADGDDGGAFQFVREYPSMEKCKADFSRG